MADVVSNKVRFDQIEGNSLKRPFKVGTTWFLVDAFWFRNCGAWCADMPDSRYPGRIDNSAIFYGIQTQPNFFTGSTVNIIIIFFFINRENQTATIWLN